MFNYRPGDIDSFYCYVYEWVDELNFCINPLNYIENCESYICAAKMKFLRHKWTGNGAVQLIWIPPFSLKGILDGEIGQFLEKFGDSWSRGLILWHVKQVDDGLSFLLSPVKLSIPDFGLEM